MVVVAGIAHVSTDDQLVVRVHLGHGRGTSGTSSGGVVLVTCRKAGTGQKIAAGRCFRRVRRRFLRRHTRY